MKKLLLILFIFHFSFGHHSFGGGCTPCSAQYTNLINFTGTLGTYIGDNPSNSSLILSAGVLYGMTEEGGANGYGNIFSVQTNGTNFNNLINFTGTSGSYIGGYPIGSLTLSGDTLYGMTSEQGGIGDGNIFSVQINGTNFKDLVDFTGTTGSYIGYEPYDGSLALSGDTLYGMTWEYGTTGFGNIFSVQTNGTNFKDLVDFAGTTGSFLGDQPYGSLILSGDTLYGMTNEGGINGYGNIFSVQTNGTNFKDLIDFTYTSGSYIGGYPTGSLTLSGDTLYGMTYAGGVNNDGNIFSVQTNGTNFKDLIDFTRTSGSYIGDRPWGSLTLSGTTLYGMTEFGGIYGYGNIFSVQTNRMNFKDLIDFTSDTGSYIGGRPGGSLTLSGDTLYGMTSEYTVSLGNLFSYIDTTVTTSINQLLAGSGQLKIYPNPNNGLFTVALSHAELVSASQTIVEVYNILGEKIYTSTLPPQNGGGVSLAYQINISSKPDGVYFYRVIAENGELIGEGKLVVEH